MTLIFPLTLFQVKHNLLLAIELKMLHEVIDWIVLRSHSISLILQNFLDGLNGVIIKVTNHNINSFCSIVGYGAPRCGDKPPIKAIYFLISQSSVVNCCATNTISIEIASYCSRDRCVATSSGHSELTGVALGESYTVPVDIHIAYGGNPGYPVGCADVEALCD